METERLLYNGLLIVVVGLCLRITCALFNRFFAKGSPIALTMMGCLVIAAIPCLIGAAVDYLMFILMSLEADLHKKPDLGAVVVAFAAVMILRIAILIAALMMLAKIPISRAIVITVVVTIMSSVLIFIVGIVVAFSLAGLVGVGSR